MSEHALQKLEALLFASGDGITKKRLMKMLQCDLDCLESLLRSLHEGRQGGVVVVDDGSRVALATHPDLGCFIRDFKNESVDTPLSKAAQETLAVVAYAGPISKIDLDFLRGLNTQYMLRRLAMRDLIADERRGRSRMISVTLEFLLHLGVRRSQDLPDYTTVRRTILDGIHSVKKQVNSV